MNSYRKTWTQAIQEINEALKPADKKVLDAFYNKEKASGKLLDTDGKSLDKMGMGGQQIAVWKGDKVKITAVSDVKSTEEILRALKKSIPSGLFEEVEVEEGFALQMKMAASDIETYAKKHGGIDKKDMMKVASMLKKGDKKGALKYIKTLDSDPRDWLLKTIGEEEGIRKVDFMDGIDEVADLKKLKKQYDKNEDENRHTENYLLLAKNFGTPDEVKKIKEIMKRNEKQGSTSSRDNDWMYKNINPYYKKLTQKEEVEIDEKRKSAKDVGMECQECGKRFRSKNPKYGVTKCPKCKSTDIDVSFGEEVEIDEAPDYELYHKDFSSAMQHAYAHAKKKGFTVDPKEIDDKVATGPKKPSSGKTNRYILGTDKKKKVHIQVANLDNKKYELNMYIEETEKENMDLNDTVKQVIMGEHKGKKPHKHPHKEDTDKSEPGTQGDDKEYAKKRDAVLKKFGVESCGECETEEEKKACFKALDDAHVADHEEGYRYNPHPPEGKPTAKKHKPDKSIVKSPTESKLFSHIRKMMRGEK